jgi:hypothetical protein
VFVRLAQQVIVRAEGVFAFFVDSVFFVVVGEERVALFFVALRRADASARGGLGDVRDPAGVAARARAASARRGLSQTSTTSASPPASRNRGVAGPGSKHTSARNRPRRGEEVFLPVFVFSARAEARCSSSSSSSSS